MQTSHCEHRISRLATLPAPTALCLVVARAAGHTTNVIAILRNQFADVLRVLSGLCARVGDCAAEPNVIAHDIHAIGILKHIIDVALSNAEAPVDVAAIVRVVTISHFPSSESVCHAVRFTYTLAKRGPANHGRSCGRVPSHQLNTPSRIVVLRH
jgi:hypothetical protein